MGSLIIDLSTVLMIREIITHFSSFLMTNMDNRYKCIGGYYFSVLADVVGCASSILDPDSESLLSTLVGFCCSFSCAGAASESPSGWTEMTLMCVTDCTPSLSFSLVIVSLIVTRVPLIT